MRRVLLAAGIAGAALLPGVPLLSGSALLASSAPASKKTLVVCAPGFPGNTEQAKPSMDAFAKEAESAAGWPAGTLAAIYYETEQGGIARLAGSDAALALVPFPFFLQHARDTELIPKLLVVQGKGSAETWSLVAKKGAITSPSSLKGWEVTGMSGYSPGFVRSLVLGEWGTLPGDAPITFTSRAVSALRRAAAGEKVAVVLDGEQGEALASLPFASDLEVVTRSKPLPGTLLCTVANRIEPGAANELINALLAVHKTSSGAEVLKALRMARFERVDPAALEALTKTFAGR